MNRAKTNTAVLLALLSALLSLTLSPSVLAQASLSGTTNGLSNGVPLAGPIPGKHYYAGGKNNVIPSWMTRRQIPASLQNKVAGGRAPGDAAVIRQTELITSADPTVQYNQTPAVSQNEHPYFSTDEKYIYFDSDRVSDTVTTESPTKIFNMYRMFPDGSGLAQLLADTVNNQIEPNIAYDGNRVAYAGGGTISFTSGLDTPTTAGFNLLVYDISNGGNPLNLTTNNASGIVFTDVRHPSWAPGGSQITFAGQVGAGTPYHIFVVNVQTGVITQLTTGTSNDTSPAWSPDSHVIAFTTNAKAFSAAGPTSATSLTAGVSQTDIWVITPNVTALDPHQVTNSSSIVGGLIAANKNAAWSSLNTDPLGNIPNEPGNNAIGENLLAFASTRADSAGDGIANSVKTTFDVYFLHAGIKADPKLPGAFTVTTPETVGNPALKLRTSTPGTGIDPNDPTTRFDPNFATNEDFPSWPAYINSYRIVFQSDRSGLSDTPGQYLNIWGSTILDINAPTLLPYDIPNNEIVHVALASNPTVGQRQYSAGQTVMFAVRAADYESGVESAFLQIKCPDSAEKSADGKEHKIFFNQTGALDSTTSVINVPYESDAQAIQPYNPVPTGAFRVNTNQASANTGIRNGVPPAYLAGLGGGLPNGWPSFNQYLAGLDDAVAFSGFSNPPDYVQDNIGLMTKGQDYQNDNSYWLRLWDDGPISQGGHEPEGQVAGDGIYTNTWTTPSALPSDWTLDVILRDKAINPFQAKSTTVGCNWKIYDNVWGFTTAPFSGVSQLLYVNDYDSGQRFYQTHFGSGTTFNTGGAFLSSSYHGWPTESWMTEFDTKLVPTRGVIGTTAATVLNWVMPLGPNAYADALTQQAGPPVTGAYDIWRILCRGPVPVSVLNSYKGHVETQPADVIAGGTGPRSVFVAEKCVIWHSPYAGDLYVGPGTIVDTNTQLNLTNFVQGGGRLFLNGEDVAFALSLGQVGATSSFLTSVFKLTYATDNIGSYPTAGADTYGPRNARGSGPISWETWYDAFHNYPGLTTPDDPPGDANWYATPGEIGTPKTIGALNQLSVDGVTFTAPSTPDVSDFDATRTVNGSPAFTWVTNSAAAPIISKVVFNTGGMEAINPEWYAPPGSTGLIVLKNRRAELMHNLGDYMRTGRIFGTIRGINGALPLKGVFVRAVSNHTGKTVSTTLTLSDGSYILDGLDATGGYAIDAALPGYLTQHAVGTYFHGGYQNRVDIFMTQAQPGTIAGTVTVQTTGAPVAGVIVTATDKTLGTVFTATTATDGTYIIKNVPSNTTTGYLVKTPTSANGGDIDTLGYGGSVPTSYGGPEATAQPAVLVAPSQNVTGVNFALTLFPGSISGIVKNHDNVPTDPTVPTAGAIVTATATIGTQTYTATTAADGTYSMPSVIPGTYKVTASAPGFALAGPITATVTSKTNTVVNFIDSSAGTFALQPIPPGSLSGLVETTQGVPVPGATVAVVDATGKVLAQVTTGAAQTRTVNGSSYTYNYIVTNVPAGGTVIVGAAKTGYNPDPTPTQTVAITSGAETMGVNFTIDPLATFPSGSYTDGTPILTLASAPYEYSGIAGSSVATLLSVPAADVSSGAFTFATWLNSAAAYVFYPTPPADTFHLGVGYFISDTDANTSLALTTLGATADQTTSPDPVHAGYFAADQSFRIALKPGWNLIGEPFPYSVNFLNLNVLTADGATMDVVTAQSGSTPVLGAALWTYTAGTYQVAYTLDAYRGYWIRAFAPVTLIVSPTARQDRSVHDTRGVLQNGNRQANGWTLNLLAKAGGRSAAPATVGQTSAALDTYDRYKLQTAPAVSPKNVTMSIAHTDWGTRAGNYSIDVRSSASLTQSWTFTVTSTLPNEPVTLTWPTLATVNKQKDLILTDLDTKKVMDLRGANSYTIAANATGAVRHFQLDTHPALRNTLQVSPVVAQVNAPSRGALGSGTVNISSSITADATVQVNITKGGKPIRTVDNSTRAAGPLAVVWDGRDSTGHLVPADVYNVEVKAVDSAGHTVRQITPLVLNGR